MNAPALKNLWMYKREKTRDKEKSLCRAAVRAVIQQHPNTGGTSTFTAPRLCSEHQPLSQGLQMLSHITAQRGSFSLGRWFLCPLNVKATLLWSITLCKIISRQLWDSFVRKKGKKTCHLQWALKFKWENQEREIPVTETALFHPGAGMSLRNAGSAKNIQAWSFKPLLEIWSTLWKQSLRCLSQFSVSHSLGSCMSLDDGRGLQGICKADLPKTHFFFPY